jgi:hypothetical protein
MDCIWPATHFLFNAKVACVLENVHPFKSSRMREFWHNLWHSESFNWFCFEWLVKYVGSFPDRWLDDQLLNEFEWIKWMLFSCRGVISRWAEVCWRYIHLWSREHWVNPWSSERNTSANIVPDKQWYATISLQNAQSSPCALLTQ